MIRTVIAAAVVSTLAACGGGSDGGDTGVAWDAFYNGGVEWRCRDRSNGQFVSDIACLEQPRIDNTWPTQPAISPAGWYYGVAISVACGHPQREEVTVRGVPLSKEGHQHMPGQLYTWYDYYRGVPAAQPFWNEANTGYTTYTWRWADGTTVNWYLYRGLNYKGPASMSADARIRCLKVTVSGGVTTRAEYFTDY